MQKLLSDFHDRLSKKLSLYIETLPFKKALH